MALEKVSILWKIKELYPEIETSKKINLTVLVNQIISNIKTIHPKSSEISQESINTCIKTTVNKTLEILNK
jgi:hypothetical protein